MGAILELLLNNYIYIDIFLHFSTFFRYIYIYIYVYIYTNLNISHITFVI